jgi:hypothetical protein
MMKTVALSALQGGLAWKNIVNSACWRTPWTEISGNPLLKDLLVPAVFYIRSVSLLDAGLDALIKSRGLTVPASYLRRGRLYLEGRIRFLVDQAIIANGPTLHAIRERRNALAHDVQADVDWHGFVADAAEIERTLRDFGRAEAEVVSEFRTAARHLEQPAHKKYYLGTKGMMLAAAVEGLTSLYLTYEMTRGAYGDFREVLREGRRQRVVRQNPPAASTTT